MSNKAESIYTSKKLNKAAHEERKAARFARRKDEAFRRLSHDLGSKCYVNIYGVTMPQSPML